MNKDRKNLAFGAAVLAAGAGYLAGMLTAPKSGKETREDIRRNASQAKRDAEAKLKEIHAEISHLIADGGQRALSIKTSAKGELDTKLAQAEQAKIKVREVLSALHEGGADDAELDAAIKNAKQAVQNLKSYLRNARP